MSNKKLKIAKIFISAVVVLAISTAPALQAFSFAGEFSDSNKTCSCCCCKSELEEKSCPIKDQMSQGNCPCQVKQHLPFNSKPIESSVPNIQTKNLAVQAAEIPQIILCLNNDSPVELALKFPVSKHPPLYILNSSFLI